MILSFFDRISAQHTTHTCPISSITYPTGPLSAYNLFFQLERERLLEGEHGEILIFTPEDVANMVIMHASKPKRPHRKTHGKIGFADLARTIAARWKKLDSAGRSVFEERARLEKARYRIMVADWLERQTTHMCGSNNSNDKMVMSLLSLEAQEVQVGTNKTPVTPPTPTKPTAAAATTTNPSTMARKVSLEHSTATTSPESPLYLPNSGGNHHNMMMMNGSSNSATINNTHVVPPCKVSPVAQQPKCSVPAFDGGALSSCASHNKSDGNNLRDLLSQGDAYLREDSHLARLQKLHAMQVQMEQELNQMAMEQGYFPSLHNINAATATPCAATSSNNNMGGVLGAAYSNYNNTNTNNKFAPIHLPTTMGVNGVTLPALPQLLHTQHMMNPANFLMPKQHQQGGPQFLFAPFVSQQPHMHEGNDNDNNNNDDHHHDVVADESWTHAAFDPRADLTTPTQELDLVDDDADDEDHSTHGDELHWF